MSDPVTAPRHYEGSIIECKDAMGSMMDGQRTWMANNLQSLAIPAQAFYWWGCTFKYLWRWPNKGGLEDLKKCRQCLDFLINELEDQCWTEE